MSLRLLWRRGLPVLAGTMALAVAAPAVASADSLTLTPSSVPAASTSTNVEFHYSFAAPTSNITTELPPGLLANATIDGGACLGTTATLGSSTLPPAACLVATGTIQGAAPAEAFLVAPPANGDIAGLDLAVNSGAGFVNTAVADVAVRPASDPHGVGLNLAFKSLAAPVSDVDLTFTDLRMPTSCPSTPANVIVTSDGGTATAPLAVTGCSSLAYNPAVSATVKKDSGDDGAEVISTVTQSNAATESASKSTMLGFGSSLSPNATAVAACFASPCRVGTATAASPLLPSAAFAGGTVTLGGSLIAPTLTISFPAVNLSLVGAVNLTNNTVTFSNEPDVPISSLTVDVTGPASGGKAFNTSCAASALTGAFTAWSGATKNDSAQVQYQGCPASGTAGKPVGVAVISGLATGHPKLKFKVKHGTNAPNIRSVSFKAPSGLKLHSKCTKRHGKIACKGLSVSGGKIKSVKLSGGGLTITLAKPAGKVTVTAKGPMLTETKALQTKVKKHKVKTITFSVKVKDAKGTTTTLRLKLKA